MKLNFPGKKKKKKFLFDRSRGEAQIEFPGSLRVKKVKSIYQGTKYFNRFQWSPQVNGTIPNNLEFQTNKKKISVLRRKRTWRVKALVCFVTKKLVRFTK